MDAPAVRGRRQAARSRGRPRPVRGPLTRATAAVIGAGPGGLMAAEVLARGGVQVTLFERMRSPGRKLLLAGRGGLNLTHSEPLDLLLERYGPARPWLEPPLRAFTPDDLRAWCDGLGQDTFVGSSGRVFPSAFRATPLLRAWLAQLRSLDVDIRLGQRWLGWMDDELLFDTGTVRTDLTVLALGGASWPRVGADGAWVAALAGAGVTVAPLRPANCGFDVTWSSVFRDRFAGTPLKNVAVSHAGSSARGDTTITTAGIEGGAVYAISAALRDRIEAEGAAVLTLDLLPDVAAAAVVARLGRGRSKDSVAAALRRIPGVHAVGAGLVREVTANAPPTDPTALARLLKALPLRLVGVQPLDRAISTAGGVSLDEVDEAFMLRKRPGTFVVGEMLDWEAPTGGYLLQATFSTAVAAARGALEWIRRAPPRDA